jgi:nucleoside-diphosphate-sugar epimerase
MELILGHNGYIGNLFYTNFKDKIDFLVYEDKIFNIDKINDLIINNNITTVYNFFQKRSTKNIIRFKESQINYFKKVLLLCRKYDIKLVHSSSYAVINNLCETKDEKLYKKIKKYQEELILKNLNKYIIFRFPSVYSSNVPEDMLLYRMTFDENFLLTNLNKCHFITSFDDIKDYIIKNNILNLNDSIINIPAEEYNLKELYNLAKKNHFKLNKKK